MIEKRRKGWGKKEREREREREIKRGDSQHTA